MLPSEILKKRITERGEVSDGDKKTIRGWFTNLTKEYKQGIIIDGMVVAGLGEKDVYEIGSEVKLARFLLTHSILPFDSAPYQQLGKILNKIIESNNITESYFLAIIAKGPEQGFSMVVYDFIMVGLSWMPEALQWNKNETDIIVGMLAHEVAHQELNHPFIRFQYLMTGCEDNSVPIEKFEQDQDLEADSRAVMYLKKAGYSPNGLLVIFKAAKEYFVWQGAGGAKNDRLVLLEERIQNIENLMRNLDKME